MKTAPYITQLATELAVLKKEVVAKANKARCISNPILYKRIKDTLSERIEAGSGPGLTYVVDVAYGKLEVGTGFKATIALTLGTDIYTI